MSIFAIGFALLYPIVFARSLTIFPALKGTASSAIMSARYLICAWLTGLTTRLYGNSVLSFGIVIVVATMVSVLLCLYLLRTDDFLLDID